MALTGRQRLFIPYVWLIVTLGFAVSVFSATRLQTASMDRRFALLVFITLAIGSRITIQIPRIKGHISVSDTLIFLAILLFQGEAAILLAGAEAFFSSVWLESRARAVQLRQKALMVIFNCAVMIVSTFLTVWALRLCFGRTFETVNMGNASLYIVALCLIGLVQYVFNSGLIAVALALKNDLPIWPAWRSNFLWTSLTYFAGASAAGIIARLIGVLGFYAFVAAIPIIAIVYITYRTYLKNIEGSIRQAEQAERHVEELNHYINEQERISRALQESEAHFRGSFDYAAIGMALVSTNGRWLRVNNSLCELVGYSEAELLAKAFPDLTHPDDLDHNLAYVEQLLAGLILSCQMEKRYIHKSGHVVWVLLSASLVRDAQGEPLHFLTQIQDITERKRAEETLKSLSLVDELTGLYNRRGFLAFAEHYYNQARRAHKRLMVFYADLDGMKQINDTYGHKEGDSALARTAHILRATFRDSDVIARIGGDEFTILATGASGDDAENICARLQENIRQFNLQDGHRFNLSLSIGVAYFSSNCAFSIEELMTQADDAMYRNKRRKKLLNAAEPDGGELALTAPPRAFTNDNVEIKSGDRGNSSQHQLDAPSPSGPINLETAREVHETFAPGPATGTPAVTGTDIFMSAPATNSQSQAHLPAQAFEDITTLATQICSAPIALVNLARAEKQWFKSEVGWTSEEESREVAFCAQVGPLDESLVISDTLKDARFATNPLVTSEASIRFYAGQSLVNAAGERFGTLCVIDCVPRELTGEQEQALKVLSRQAATLLLMNESASAFAPSGRKPSRADERALHDWNLFVEKLEQADEQARLRDNHQFAVLFLDLDHFKNINNSLGRKIGDAVLDAFGQRLQNCLRRADTVARLGGDEFAILLDRVEDASDITQVIERIRKDLNLPFILSGHEVFITTSIGIALSRTGYEQPADLLRDAETAMYGAKARGKSHHEVFDKTMRARIVQRLQLETDMRRAVEREELRVHYQPVISLRTGRISGFEALVRWQHDARGLLLPAEFISVAEETGMIISLGQWVLRESCRQMQEWQQRGLFSDGPLNLSVNLSSKQFTQHDLVEQIKHILRETNFDPRRLQLEITESVAMGNAEATTNMLAQLKTLGVHILIDDFGTGYSSLSYLHRFPVNTLKIDRSFISRLGLVGAHDEIAQTIVRLASNLGMEVVAEGVETESQLAHLRTLKCGYAQGYLFSRPIDGEAAESLLRKKVCWQLEGAQPDNLILAPANLEN
ncbi:MAG TPA: diguanylate cyclase [Pyrinomonadaceae bacterium]|jgi:diguanylate cyclase (GGDEF)-like protein/PAS domain S-box-containing protein|nr:diguanylate cyclase [Pyrinomonadaceae bacterium]